MSEYKTFKVGINITCTVNWTHRTAATLHTPETWLFQVSKYRA